MLDAGQSAVEKRVFSQSDFNRFAALSGDDNPIHVDREFAAGTRFGRTVCHGMLLYSTLNGMLGRELPGPGMVQLEQSLTFPTPTFAGEEVTIHLDVVEVQWEEGIIVLDTAITRPNGELSCQGQSVVTNKPGQLGRWRPAEMDKLVSEVDTFKGLHLGQKATLSRTFSRDDLTDYVDLTGDTNPIYYDGAYARAAGLKGPLIPGGLLGGLFSSLLGTTLPGRGTNWLKQRLQFLKPAYIDEPILASVEIVRFRPDKELVNLRTVCQNQAFEVVCTGEALVLVRDLLSDTR